MPVVVLVVIAATALVLVLIALGPSRRIREEAQIEAHDYYAVMAGEASPDPDEPDEPGDPGERGTAGEGDDESGPALGDEAIP